MRKMPLAMLTRPTLAPGQASAPSIWCPGWLGQLLRSFLPAPLQAGWRSLVLLLPGDRTSSVPPRRAWIFCPRGQPVGALAGTYTEPVPRFP